MTSASGSHAHSEVDRQLDDETQERTTEEAIEEQTDELEQVQAQAAEYLDQLQRAQAEFANYKKRIERERQEFVSLANAALISSLLPILDDFERALDTVPDDLQDQTWVDGLLLIERSLRKTLEEEGVSEIDSVGKTFDPEFHHAVVREESSEYEEDEVISELQKGYRLHDKVLRPSMVRVAAMPSDKKNKDPE